MNGSSTNDLQRQQRNKQNNQSCNGQKRVTVTVTVRQQRDGGTGDVAAGFPTHLACGVPTISPDNVLSGNRWNHRKWKARTVSKLFTGLSCGDESSQPRQRSSEDPNVVATLAE